MNQPPSAAVGVTDAQATEDVELKAAMSRAADSLQVRYEVTNGTDRPIVVLNFVQIPIAETDSNADRVFVEVDESGVVTISQRALVEKQPYSTRPLHRMRVVAPGESLQGEFTLALPLQALVPMPDPSQSIPNPPERARLCLAYVPSQLIPENVLAQLPANELQPVSPQLPKQQRELCSEVVEL